MVNALRRNRAVLLVVALAALAVACQGPEPAQPAAGPSVGAATPQRGGTLRMGLTTDPGRLDIHQSGDGPALAAVVPIYSMLLRDIPNRWTELQGDLATKWEPSSDGRRWTFTLRSDATWHDGRAVTADDVVYNLNRLITPPPGFRPANAGCITQMGAAARKVDPTHVEVELRAPVVAFLQCVGMAYVRIQPQHILEPVDLQERSRDLRPAELIGSGPFKFKSYERGSAWVLERDPQYYLAGQPYLDGLTYFIIPDINTRLASLNAGQLDITTMSERLTPSLAKKLKADMGDRVTILQAESAGLTGLYFNTVAGPFRDVRLRRAVHLALNRQAMLEFVEGGEGNITFPICSCWEWVYDQQHYLALPGWRADKTADLKEAKRLVDEVTGGKGVDVVITYRTSNPSPQYAQLEQQQLAEAGIRATLEPLESAIAQERYRKGQFQMAGEHPSAIPFMDPDSMVALLFLPGGDRNWGKWQNQEFNDLYARESVLQDRSERAKLLRRMVDIVEEEVPLTGLTASAKLIPVSSTVRALDKAPASAISDLRFDWVWLAR